MSGDLLQAWEGTLRRRGGQTAIAQAADGVTCTFRELDLRSRQWLAEHAPTAGSLEGRAAVFSVANGIDWFAIFLGLLRGGAVLVPLDSSEPPAAQQRLAAAIRAGYWWDGAGLVALGRPLRHRSPACLVKMTSGTTGGPRALAFSAAQLIADARQVTSTMGIRTRDLNYALIPLGHSYGLGNLAVPLIAQGVPLVCGALPLPHAIASDFRKWRPTVFPCVPAVWRALAAAGVGLASFRSLRLAVSAGSPLPPEVARDFRGRFGLPLRNFYGSSETGGIAYDRTGNSTLAGGVGRPIRAVEVTALPGHRIRIRSAAVFTRGNRGARRGLGSWIPADRVEIGARGELRLAGRRGAIVKVAGRRVNLAEIEASLRGLNGVREAWVQLGPGADAVVGAALATERPVAEIRAELLLSTAAWKIPRKWAIMPRLPLTPRGKVDSHRLSSRLFG